MAPSKKFLQPINLLNAASDPTSADRGDFYYNTTSEKIRYYDGTQWNDVGSGTGGGIENIVDDLTPQLGGDLDGNGFGIDNIDYIDFDTTTTTQPAEGMLVWDDGEGTLQLGAKGGNVNISLGQEMVVLCYNGSGFPMSDGDVVYVQGAQGQRPNITLASAASEAGSSKTLGIVTEPIAAGAEGFVTTFGVVNNVNTLGFTEGAALWLSTTPGDYTQTKPQSPNHLVFIGYCLNASENAGRIFVEPQNGYELEELHNVLITSESDNDIVSYESATGLWKNQNLATAIGEVDGAGSGIDADLLDGQQGTYYLDWTNTTNKPDPTITLGGDLTGSVTLTDLASGTLTAFVVDNSHNHTSSNISDFTEATQDVVGGMVSTNTESGISVTYDDTNGKLNFDVNDPTIALSGDVTGSGTITNLGNVTITATVVDDSHNHIISNVDGLQTALDGKQPLDGDLTAIAGITGTSGLLKKTAADTWSLDTNTYLTGNQTITLTGDVSGSGTTSINVTVADDSHNHVISNVDGLQTALDAKAPLASPALTGTPTAPTAAAGTNTTQIATTAFVQTATAALVDAAPTTLDTLNELAAALGDDPNFATTVSTALGNKQPLDSDLTAIAGLAGTSGFLKKTAADTWALDTNSYLTGNQTITLTGDVSGSGTTSISVTVADDSHNHIISNVDGLQTALNAKLDSASYTASDVLTKIKTVDGATSGLDADLLDGQHGSYYLDWTNTTNKPDPTITLGGDLSGSVTLTDLASGTLTATVADDSHNHIISNIDGLQTALDAKASLSGDTFTGNVGIQGISNSLKVGDILGDNYTEIKHVNSDAYGFDFEYSNASVVLNLQGTINEVLLLGDVTNGGDYTLLGSGISPDGGTSWVKKFDLRGTGELYVGSTGTSRVWHEGNDGASSGLDSDLLDGQHGSYYLDWTNTTNKPDPTITLGGDASGSLTLTNLAGGTLTVTVADDSHNHVISNIDGLQTALDAKADDNAVVHLAGTETITGSKTFSTNTYFDGFISSNELRNRTGQQLILNAGESAGYATGQTGEQVYVNAEGGLQVNSSPDNWTTGWTTRKTTTICDSSGNSSFPGNVSITGTLTATSKSFDIEHPTKENMRLRYGSLEGEEHGVYIRGKSNSSIITLPDYWTGLVNEDSITVQLTPIGKHKNLYVKDISNNTVTIGGCRGEFEFFYFIQAERKDIDKLVVEYGS